MRWILYCTTIFSSLSYSNSVFANSQDGDHPVILDYYPRCNYQVIAEKVLKESSFISQHDIDGTENKVIQQLKQKVFNEAASASADGIILLSLDKQRITHNAFVSRQNNTNVLLQLTLVTQLIRQCNEDASKAQKPTPYNGAFQRVIAVEQFKLNPITIQAPQASVISETSNQPDVSATISLNDGFYGAKPGTSRDALLQLFGHPSAEFTFSDNVKALLYGKSVWCLLQDDRLYAIQHKANYLTAAAIRLLTEDPRFDSQKWQLDNVFPTRSPLSAIKEHYGSALQPLDQFHYQIAQRDLVLDINFAAYRSLSDGKEEVRMTDVSLRTAASMALQPKPFMTESTDVLQILNTVTKSDSITNFQQSAARSLPALHVIHHRKEASVIIYDNVFAIHFDAGNATAIRVQPLFNAEHATEKMNLYLQQLGQPLNRTQFLQQYPDAFELAGKLQVFAEKYDITATFDDGDGARLDSLYLEFH